MAACASLLSHCGRLCCLRRRFAVSHIRGSCTIRSIHLKELGQCREPYLQKWNPEFPRVTCRAQSK